jgi:hypothetical protein
MATNPGPLNDIFNRARFTARLIGQRGRRRHTLRWIASLRPGYLLSHGLPWLVFDAIDYLDRLDLRGWRVFEYGSGGSTLYWLRRGARVTSVEHEPGWHARLSAMLPPQAALDYRLVPPEPEPEPAPQRDPADPADCVSAGYPRDRLSYRRYVAQIDSCADQSLDLVLVDGRARPACLAHAAPKLRPGGLLILDNSERDYYTARTGPYLADYLPLVFAGSVPQIPVYSQTTIYVRRPALQTVTLDAAGAGS